MYQYVAHMPRIGNSSLSNLSPPHFSERTAKGQALTSRPLRPRLRHLVSHIPAAAVDGKTPWWERNSAPNMVSVNSAEELIHELSEARDRLVVVDFFARWCGSCKALYPKLCKICEANPDVLLLKLNFDDNKQLCKTLGIKVLPFFQFYRGAEGQVAAFSASVSKVQRLRDAVTEFGPPRCSLGSGPLVEQLTGELQQGDSTAAIDSNGTSREQQPDSEVAVSV